MWKRGKRSFSKSADAVAFLGEGDRRRGAGGTAAGDREVEIVGAGRVAHGWSGEPREPPGHEPDGWTSILAEVFRDPILSAFDRLHADQPERPLVASPSRLATVADVHRQAGELAGRLHEHGLVPGRLVGLVAPNGPGFLVGYLALRRCGLVPVLCDLAIPPHALEGILARFDVAGCLSLSDAWPRGGEHWTFVTRLGAVVRHLPRRSGRSS